jgi:hypothetical protein
MRLLAAIGAALLALGIGTASAAEVRVAPASATWGVSGAGVSAAGDLPLVPGTKDGEFFIGTGVPGQSLTLGGQDQGWQVVFNSGRLDADPIITYNFGVTNFTGGSLNFVFEFSTPLSPSFGDPVSVGASIGQTFTWIGGTPYVFTPTAATTAVASLNGGALDMGVGVGAAYTNPATFFGSDTNSATIPLFVTSYGGGPYTDFKVRLQFDLSGGDSAVAFNGLAIIEPVPLPASLPLLAAGLGLLGWFARRGR